jgi:hypothetical protein
MLSVESDTLRPGRGRFQVTPGNRLFVFYHVYGKDGGFSENRVVEIMQDHRLGKPVRVDLKQPFGSFFTATVRGGSEPSHIIDVFGEAGNQEMHYTRIRIIPD